MADRYLLMEADAILADFAEQTEAYELMKFMRCNNQGRLYQVIDSDLME